GGTLLSPGFRPRLLIFDSCGVGWLRSISIVQCRILCITNAPPSQIVKAPACPAPEGSENLPQTFFRKRKRPKTCHRRFFKSGSFRNLPGDLFSKAEASETFPEMFFQKRKLPKSSRRRFFKSGSIRNLPGDLFSKAEASGGQPLLYFWEAIPLCVADTPYFFKM
ncbi:MAG: hypothetical protein LBH61_07860, partial [Dysgonamonadaceae bacterium]|nr:hypothetical protein [Dysgonamonadaceae bacterium]